jgi:transposase InsO family protein
MDTCKIGKNLYQFTAVDDCTRLRVLALYDSRSGQNAVQFLLEKVIPQFPFPLQRVQTDRGREFLAMDFQDALRQNCIKFRPNRPYSPHLNGKVERSQRTDRSEFWPTVDRKSERNALEAQLAEWQRFYNEERTHYTLGKTPRQRLDETKDLVPPMEAVKAAFDPVREGYRTNYRAAWSPQ